MKKKNGIRIVISLVFCAGVMLVSGCGSLSLFSSRHVHYHASEKADEKVSQLEKRVEVLEKKLGDK